MIDIEILKPYSYMFNWLTSSFDMQQICILRGRLDRFCCSCIQSYNAEIKIYGGVESIFCRNLSFLHYPNLFWQAVGDPEGLQIGLTSLQLIFVSQLINFNSLITNWAQLYKKKLYSVLNKNGNVLYVFILA